MIPILNTVIFKELVVWSYFDLFSWIEGSNILGDYFIKGAGSIEGLHIVKFEIQIITVKEYCDDDASGLYGKFEICCVLHYFFNERLR